MQSASATNVLAGATDGVSIGATGPFPSAIPTARVIIIATVGGVAINGADSRDKVRENAKKQQENRGLFGHLREKSEIYLEIEKTLRKFIKNH